MSRLAFADEDLPPTPRKPGKVLRSRRRRPLHPDQIASQLREQAVATSGVGPTPYGWLVIVYLDNQTGPNGLPKRIVRETDPNATLADARRILASETAIHGPRNAWIVAKTLPNQRTVRP